MEGIAGATAQVAIATEATTPFDYRSRQLGSPHPFSCSLSCLVSPHPTASFCILKK